MKLKLVVIALLISAALISLVPVNSSEEALLKTVALSSVQINGNCTGTIIKPGLVLTAYHCVASVGESSAFMVRYKNMYVMMKFKAGDATDNVDLALLEGPEIADPAKISNYAPVPLKEHFVVGHPWGAINQIVSFLLYAGVEPTPVGDFDIYSGAVAPGNSGSGIFNSRGKLVGVVLRAPRSHAVYVLSVSYYNLIKFLKEQNIQ